MPCNFDHYKAAVVQVANGIKYTHAKLAQILWDWDLLASIAMVVAMFPVAIVFLWSMYTLIPKLVHWYYDKTITQKALDWFTSQGLAFLGFKHSTAIISVVSGAIFYVLIRAAVAFPDYLIFSLPALVVLFIGISILGFFVSGNVPNNPVARNRYFKRFYSPTVTGLGLAIGTVTLDFLINTAAIAWNMFQTA